MIFPNSSAMDATAASGGPITVLPQIFTGSPEQIAKHVTDLLKKASEFTALYTDFTKAAHQLEQVWSGAASQTALKKISDSLGSLTKIIGVVEKGAELLGVSGALVKAAQEAYREVVSAVNPTVAALMSNWWTYGAAVALSTATSASLRAFITAIGALLKALGAVQLANQISQLATIIGDIEKLSGGKTTGATTPATGGNAAISGTPVTSPLAPAPVASATGQAVAGGTGASGPAPVTPGFTDYTPPALAGGGAAAGGSGATVTPDTWIPVDHVASTLPAPAVPVSNDHVIIRTDLTTGHSEIEAPAGQDAKVDIDITYNDRHYTEHVVYDAANR